MAEETQKLHCQVSLAQIGLLFRLLGRFGQKPVPKAYAVTAKETRPLRYYGVAFKSVSSGPLASHADAIGLLVAFKATVCRVSASE